MPGHCDDRPYKPALWLFILHAYPAWPIISLHHFATEFLNDECQHKGKYGECHKYTQITENNSVRLADCLLYTSDAADE